MVPEGESDKFRSVALFMLRHVLNLQVLVGIKETPYALIAWHYRTSCYEIDKIDRLVIVQMGYSDVV